jgi:hypothetical protein
MPLPGCCVSAGTLMRNYGATNVAPTQKDKPLLSFKRPRFQTYKPCWNEYKWVPTELETKISVLASASSNLLDWTGQLSVGRRSRRLAVLSCVVSSRYLATTSVQTEAFTRALVALIYRV